VPRRRTLADVPATPRTPLPPLAAGALVFGASAAVLVLEILAARLLAPYVGVTLETYTAIIGVVLAGIACGSWAGGRLADRATPRRLLGPELIAGGLLAMATLPVVRLLGEAGEDGGTADLALLGLLGFFPPAAVLSAVVPTVVKLQLGDLGETGAVVGRLSALSTLGALFGTFATGFVLVAALPNAPIVLGVGGALVLAGVVVTARLRAAAAAGAGALLLASAGIAAGSPCDVESAYFCARVTVDPDRPTGRVLELDDLRHSYVDLADPLHLEFRYARLIGDVVETLPRGPLTALHVGGGGFTLPRYIEARRPGSRNVVLEVDREVVALARRELALRTGPALRVRAGDARVSLRGERDRTYDVVVGDAFGGRAVPWHLTTREFVAGVRRVLRPGGTYTVNLLDEPPLRFARAEALTLRRAFAHVAALVAPGTVEGRRGGNLVLVASDRPLPLAAMARRRAARGARERALAGPGLERFTAGERELTDGLAPVDQLLTTSR
jgi:spermidine synthase